MKICLCGRTALTLLRTWSHDNAITLSTFHHLRPGDASHLPARLLREVTSLRHCAHTEAEIDEVVDSIGSSSLARTIRRLWAQAGKGQPFHVMISLLPGKMPTSRVAFHFAPAEFPSSSFLEVLPGVLTVSPELLFVQLGRNLLFGSHLALGYELCGCYPLSDSSGLVRAPLSSPSLLRSFAEKAHRISGRCQSQQVLRFVNAKAASVMEAEVSALATASIKRGGFGMAPPLLNEPVALSRHAAAIARSSTLVLDAFWPDGAVALEYEGRGAHGAERQRIRDSRRRDALNADGIEVLTVTAPQFSSYTEFGSLMEQIRRKLGRRKRRMPVDFLEQQGRLREQLRQFHNDRQPPSATLRSFPEIFE